MKVSDRTALPPPEEFPLGSTESRAAAGLCSKGAKKACDASSEMDMAHRPPRRFEDPLGAVGPWELRDGILWRTILIPRGADEETKRRLLAAPMRRRYQQLAGEDGSPTRPLDFITMSGASTRVDCGCLTTKGSGGRSRTW